MGRITPSFRQLFKKQIAELKKKRGFQDTLVSREHRKALNLLLRDAWSAESAALSNACIPYVLDALNLMANVHNKKCIEELEKEILELECLLKERKARMNQFSK
jgi:hypothetical protein